MNLFKYFHIVITLIILIAVNVNKNLIKKKYEICYKNNLEKQQSLLKYKCEFYYLNTPEKVMNRIDKNHYIHIPKNHILTVHEWEKVSKILWLL